MLRIDCRIGSATGDCPGAGAWEERWLLWSEGCARSYEPSGEDIGVVTPGGEREGRPPPDPRGETVPRMPWQLRARGPLLVALHWVDVECARAQVPLELRIIPFLPGRTVGGLFLASYGPGSDLEYHELIVSAAAVWHRRRPCAWVTHLFVDSQLSVEGGRSLLGAPKHLARFAWDASARRVTVGGPERPICRLSYGRQIWLWRQRVRLLALHRDVRDPDGRTASVHGNELRARWGLTRARVEIPEESPLRNLGFGQPVLGGCGREADLLLGGAPFLPLERVPVSAGGATPLPQSSRASAGDQ